MMFFRKIKGVHGYIGVKSNSKTLLFFLELVRNLTINDNDKILYFPSCTVANILHI
jgi:hypothetical protein